MGLSLKKELEVLYAIYAFIFFAPRTSAGLRSTNLASYDEQIISTVRSRYAGIQGLRPGLSNGEPGGNNCAIPSMVYASWAQAVCG